MTWLRGLTHSHPAPAGSFGPLEWRVLEALWAFGALASVRDLQPQFPEIAYTTLMTTLDRLHRKGVLDRAKQGRAFLYAPLHSRAELESGFAANALRAAIDSGLSRSGGDHATLRPLMSCFIDAVGERDEALLIELETLVRARRAELERKPR
jgi:predicted transcriptional regulator